MRGASRTASHRTCDHHHELRQVDLAVDDQLFRAFHLESLRAVGGLTLQLIDNCFLELLFKHRRFLFEPPCLPNWKNRATSFVPAVDRSFRPPAGRREPSGCSGVTVSQEAHVQPALDTDDAVLPPAAVHAGRLNHRQEASCRLLAEETPVALIYNGMTLAVLMATPAD